MIGPRPYLLSVLAILALVVVGLDVSKRASPCSTARDLVNAREYTEARASYSVVLEHDDHSACAKAGLSQATQGECVAAERIADRDSTEAQHQLLAVAEADPPPGPDSCVWQELSSLASTTKTNAKATS